MLLIMSTDFLHHYPLTIIMKGTLTVNTVLYREIFKERQLKEAPRSFVDCYRNIKSTELSVIEITVHSNKLRQIYNTTKLA